MDLVWWDYAPETMGYIEQWLDDAAVKTTGLDKGFRSFYEYCANEEGYIPGENFWCKVISKDAQPLAVIAFCEYERKVIIMELLIAPEKRGQGMGTEILKELLENKNITFRKNIKTARYTVPSGNFMFIIRRLRLPLLLR